MTSIEAQKKVWKEPQKKPFSIYDMFLFLPGTELLFAVIGPITRVTLCYMDTIIFVLMVIHLVLVIHLP
jgi:hypothetical protein